MEMRLSSPVVIHIISHCSRALTLRENNAHRVVKPKDIPITAKK